jgi:predicted ATPase
MASALAPGQSTLVGRRRELTALRSALAMATSGRLQVVLLSGEPGIGKTRLLDEIAARASGEGARVLRGGSFEAEGMPPYLPFLEALGDYVRTAPLEALRAQVGPSVDILSTILPELEDRLGPAARLHALPAEQARLRLFEAVGAFLAAIAAAAPVLLILDDLHWVDPASLDLLAYVARRYRTARLMVLGACRPTEGAEHAALQRVLVELQRQRVLTTLSLEPLPADDSAALTASVLGGEASAEVGRRIHEQSEGNPFFAEELLRWWTETGALAQRGQRWTLVRGPLDTLPPASRPPSSSDSRGWRRGWRRSSAPRRSSAAPSSRRS